MQPKFHLENVVLTSGSSTQVFSIVLLITPRKSLLFCPVTVAALCQAEATFNSVIRIVS